MPNTRQADQKQFAVYCDIIDETGGIATIATILASNNIGIKNIGIIHNREFEEGVLRIEFYDESSSSKASALLKNTDIYRIRSLRKKQYLNRRKKQWN